MKVKGWGSDVGRHPSERERERETETEREREIRG